MGKRHKYGAAPNEDRTWNDVLYGSKAEMHYAQQLALLLESGEVTFVHHQPGTWWLGCPENRYRPDFIVRMADNSLHIVDVKGSDTRVWTKNKRLWAKYGDLPLHVVKKKGTRFVTVEIIEGGG